MSRKRDSSTIFRIIDFESDRANHHRDRMFTFDYSHFQETLLLQDVNRGLAAGNTRSTEQENLGSGSSNTSEKRTDRNVAWGTACNTAWGAACTACTTATSTSVTAWGAWDTASATAWTTVVGLGETLHLVISQLKTLRLLIPEGHGEDDRASFADSSRSVDAREEFRAAQAVVGELDFY
jgi:hypothetical protein